MSRSRPARMRTKIVRSRKSPLPLASPLLAQRPPSAFIRGKNRGLVDQPGRDIYGMQPNKAVPPAFNCPVCGTLRQPAKFAPHLEKCMGMGGRESRRAATRVRTVLLLLCFPPLRETALTRCARYRRDNLYSRFLRLSHIFLRHCDPPLLLKLFRRLLKVRLP